MMGPPTSLPPPEEESLLSGGTVVDPSAETSGTVAAKNKMDPKIKAVKTSQAMLLLNMRLFLFAFCRRRIVVSRAVLSIVSGSLRLLLVMLLLSDMTLMVFAFYDGTLLMLLLSFTEMFVWLNFFL